MLCVPFLVVGPLLVVAGPVVSATALGGALPPRGSVHAASQVPLSAIGASPVSQTITFTSTPAAGEGLGGSYTVTATATSGLAVTFSVDGASTVGACTMSGPTVTFTGAGTCVIDADQAGDADYSAAPRLQQDVDITDVAASCTIDWTGAGGTGAWTTPADWARLSGTGALPTNSDVTCIPGGSDLALSSSDPSESAGILLLGNVDGSGTATLVVDGTLNVSGGRIYTGGSLEVGSGGTVSAGGTFTNTGSISVTGSGAAFGDTSTFDNHTGGSIAVAAGGTLTENPNDTFVQDGGTTSGDVTIDEANMVFDAGGTAAFSVEAAGASDVTGAPFAGETLTLQPNAQVVMGNSTNIGTIDLEAGSQLNNGGTITNDGIVDSQVSVAAGVTIAGGTFVNNGNLILETGNATDVTGSYSQGSAGTLTADLGAATGFGNVVVGGSASVAGTLVVNTTFSPTIGSTSTILASGDESGQFSTDVFNGGTNYSVQYTSDGISLTTSPADQAALAITSTGGTYGTALTLATSGGSGVGAITYTVVDGTASGCSITSDELTLIVTSAGTCLVTATEAGDAQYNPVSSPPTTVTLGADIPVLALSGSPVTGDNAYGVTLTVPPGGVAPSDTVTVTDRSTVSCAATLTGSDTTYTGMCTIDGETAGETVSAAYGSSDLNYTTAGSNTLTVAAAAQTIQFPTLQTRLMTHPPITVRATATSGLAVAFTTTTPLVCTSAGTNGATITLVAPGKCTVEAQQAGDPDYLAATPVTRSFLVTMANQTIHFGPLRSRLLSKSPITVGATASSGLSVTFTTTTPLVCTSSGTDGATITMLKAGTCTVVAHQAGDADYKAAPRVIRSFRVIP